MRSYLWTGAFLNSKYLGTPLISTIVLIESGRTLLPGAYQLDRELDVRVGDVRVLECRCNPAR